MIATPTPCHARRLGVVVVRGERVRPPVMVGSLFARQGVVAGWFPTPGIRTALQRNIPPAIATWFLECFLCGGSIWNFGVTGQARSNRAHAVGKNGQEQIYPPLIGGYLPALFAQRNKLFLPGILPTYCFCPV